MLRSNLKIGEKRENSNKIQDGIEKIQKNQKSEIHDLENSEDLVRFQMDLIQIRNRKMRK